MKPSSPLSLFSPATARWFAARVGTPTEVQAQAWPRIAAGEHVLACAPTGSGKTLAAFLWALDRLLTGAWPGGAVRVLYVSPLKALASDVQRNLLAPLAGIRAEMAAGRAGPEPGGAPEPVPPVRVLMRTGDTPEEDRRRMLRRPPEILITTPESLNILLVSRGGRGLLTGLQTVILDEVHAVVGGKRGVHLATAVERLAPLAGEFQRLALSATVRPLERVAAWVGGFALEPLGPGLEPGYRRRPVAIVAGGAPKQYDLEVRFPGPEAGRPPAEEAASGGGGAAGGGGAPGEIWPFLTAELLARIEANRSTLIFANGRRMVEKLTRFVNEAAGRELAYSHHGSLAREVRQLVEERLKAGRLAAIVATSSLELGIDIGALDEVILVQTPPSVASAVQRIGRAGHQVGAVSRARLYPLHGRDILDAAAVARAVLAGRIESVSPITGALDVLAQVVLSMTVGESRRLDDVYHAVRSADPYHELPRRQFDLVVEMLAGRYARDGARLRPLRPLVTLDRAAGTVRARPGAAHQLYLAGGTIPDRGLYQMRLAGSRARIGELDEEFVWERAVGDTFTLGVQTWRIERVTASDVLVAPARKRAAMAPFWRGEERDRSFFLAGEVGELLEEAERDLEKPELRRRLQTECRLAPPAADALLRLLSAQARAAGGRLPHRHQVLLERVVEPETGAARELIVHAVWGGRVNRPLALALAQAFEERHGVPLDVLHEDYCLVLRAPVALDPESLFELVPRDDLERLLRARLERSGFFGARFREAAGRALLLPRAGFRRRTPLWLSRERAKQLLAAVAGYDDFPIVLEAWRECLQDAFDLPALRLLLGELASGRTAVGTFTSSGSPSPFAAEVVWKQENRLMYEDDSPIGGPSRLRPDLIQEVALSESLRPRIAPELAAELEAKLQRIHPGYAPRSAAELAEFVLERTLVPLAEWRALLAAIERDHGLEAAALVGESGSRVAAAAPGGAAGPAFVAAIEALPRIRRALELAAGGLRLWAADGEAGLPEAARVALAAFEADWGAGAAGEGDAAGEEPGAGGEAADLVSELLRFHGPVPAGWPGTVLGLAPERAREALEGLAAAGQAVIGELTAGAAATEVCDAENLERLLRLARRASRPAFEARPAAELPLFLAAWQSLAAGPGEPAGLPQVLERLLGYAAPAALWESDLLPARLPAYRPAELDALLAGTELGWFGCGPGRIAFGFESERELVLEPDSGADPDAAGLDPLPPGPGRYGLADLAVLTGRSTAELARRLWRAAWQGRLTSDSFATVRAGLAAGFRPVETAVPPPAAAGIGAGPRRPRRRGPGLDRWRAGRDLAGAWYRLPSVAPPADALEADELARERARLMLERHGFVCRELLARELPALQFGRIFRALRLMELSGEVLSGHFFAGLGGPQFIAPSAFRLLTGELPRRAAYWMNALDPASACGLGLEGLPYRLPRRLAGSHLAYRGDALVLVSERRGRTLRFLADPGDERLASALDFLAVQLTRPVGPWRTVAVETVNGRPAADSPYRELFAARFHVTGDGPRLLVGRRYA